MQEESNAPAKSLEDYWQIARARRWWILGPLFVCWVLVWGASWTIPATYRSETLILVERQKIPEDYVVPNVATNLQARLQSMTQQILSRTRLLRIIDEFKLYPTERTADTDAIVDRMRRDIHIELVESKDRRELSAFRISYLAASPQLAQQVAGQLASLFIEDNLQVQQQQSESTTEFLSGQVEEARKALAEQEAKIKDFKLSYLGELPTQMESNVQILGGLQGRQQSLSEALGRAQQEKLYLESLLAQYRSMQIASSASGQGNSPLAVDQELTRLKNELADAEARYTPKHPDVIRLRAQLAKTQKLKELIDKGLAAAQKSGASEKPTSVADLQAMSPMMQLESQLKANELQIRNTQSEVQQVQAQIKNYEARLHVTPVREQQLADLTRNYEQLQANYDSLLKKELQSQLATNLERRQQGQQFRVIDPPSLPQKPASPNRLQLSLMGLLAGLALGAATAVGLELVDGRIRSERELKTLVGVRVLTGIPRLSTPRQQRNAGRRVFAETCAAAFLFAAIIVGNLLSFYKG